MEKIPVLSEDPRGADQRCRMRVMSTRVHFSGNGALIGTVILFRYRQRVDIRSQKDGFRRLIGGAGACDLGNDACIRISAMSDTDRVKLLLDPLLRPVFLASELRMAVKIPTQPDDIPVIFPDLLQQILLLFRHFADQFFLPAASFSASTESYLLEYSVRGAISVSPIASIS